MNNNEQNKELNQFEVCEYELNCKQIKNGIRTCGFKHIKNCFEDFKNKA